MQMDADSGQACLRNFGAVPGQANPLISCNGRYLNQSEEVGPAYLPRIAMKEYCAAITGL